MRRITKSLVALAFAAGAVTTVGATSAQAQPTDGTYEGCPYGAVCIYPQNAGWNNGQPSDFFYSYGAHNLSNQYGTHVVFNNQYGGATATLCDGYNGTNCGLVLQANTYYDPDLTSVNSILLQP
jgi:hypothetical protein